MVEGLPPDAQLDRELVRRYGFEKFVELAWDQAETAEHVIEPHEAVVCAHLQAVYEGRILRLLINIPPGLTKSLLTNVFFPAWIWTMNPKFKIGCVSNDESLTLRDARKCRALIESDWYRARWPEVKLIGDSNKLSEFTTQQGGVRCSFTVRQQITGWHFDMVLLDDLHKPQSFTVGDGTKEAEYVRSWYTETLPSRFLDQKTARKVIIMQRLAENDIAGHVLENDEGYEHLMLPMEYEPERKFKTSLATDWRTEPGELLAPIRYPREVVDNLKATFANNRITSSQFQQNPIPGEGSVFKASWFENRYTELPDRLQIFHSVDATFKKAETSDFVAITTWGALAGEFFLVDGLCLRMGFVETVKAVKRAIAKWGYYTSLLIEAKANGDAIVDQLETDGVQRIVPIQPGAYGKQTRAHAVTGLLESGAVYFPKHEPPWWDEYLRQMLYFPAGKHDDYVDSTTQALSYMSGQSAARLVAALSNISRFNKVNHDRWRNK